MAHIPDIEFTITGELHPGTELLHHNCRCAIKELSSIKSWLFDVKYELRALNINNSWDGLYDLLKRLGQ